MKSDVMKRFVHTFATATAILLVMLLLVTSPVMATITNEGAKQLTTDPFNEAYPSWSPDGTKIAYLSIDSEDIVSFWVMNVDGTEKLRIDTVDSSYIELSILGLHFDWSPDSKSMAYTRRVQEGFGSDVRSIWVMDIETGEKIELASRSMYPSWSPDGTKIVYIGYLSDYFDGCDLWIMNSDGSGKRKLASNAEFNTWPSWSPDGAKIAYTSVSENQLESAKIWVIDADGVNNAQLAAGAKFPKWSPDGAKIAYQSGSSNGDFIWIMDPDGTDKKCLTTNPNSIDFSKSEWSPDSTKIAYNAGVRAEGIWVVNADGSGEHSITSYVQFFSCNPDAWSPDGNRIVYYGPEQKSRSDSVSIYVMNADGTQEKKLISDGIIPSWSPDGTKIAYMSAVSGQTNTDIWAVTIDEEKVSPAISTPTSTGATIAPNNIPDIIYEEESQSSEKKGIPGFEAVFAIAGSLAMAYLTRRRR